MLEHLNRGVVACLIPRSVIRTRIAVMWILEMPSTSDCFLRASLLALVYSTSTRSFTSELPYELGLPNLMISIWQEIKCWLGKSRTMQNGKGGGGYL